jgi:hypothetical protein
LSITQTPFLAACYIDFSAYINPSALPIATEISLVPFSLESCSTLKEGSNPGEEHINKGDLGLASF